MKNREILMKAGKFESYRKALVFLTVGACLSGLIVWGILWIIWSLI